MENGSASTCSLSDYYEKVFSRIKYLERHLKLKETKSRKKWRKLRNSELNPLNLANMNLKLRRLRWAGHVARMEQSKNAYRVLEGKPEVKRPLGRPRRRGGL